MRAPRKSVSLRKSTFSKLGQFDRIVKFDHVVKFDPLAPPIGTFYVPAKTAKGLLRRNGTLPVPVQRDVMMGDVGGHGGNKISNFHKQFKKRKYNNEMEGIASAIFAYN